jgi:hypothetical protein
MIKIDYTTSIVNPNLPPQKTVIVSNNNQPGPQGPQGVPGQDGKDGIAEIPAIINGGNF